MSRRRELDAKLALYHDLGDILGAMRSFALTELRRIARREEAQEQTASILFGALEDMAPHLPEPEYIAGDVFVLLGSVRGFCASYNEDVLGFWRDHAASADRTIIVGERLESLVAKEEGMVFVPGAANSNDTIPVIESILSAYGEAAIALGQAMGLVIVFRDANGVVKKRLWPIQLESNFKSNKIAFTHELPEHVASNVAQHCLFHTLLALLLKALHTENHMRLLQMENALKHIDENKEVVLAHRNRIRQEEIVNEIELILLKRNAA